jgi:polyhydroxyalkanoate synthase subunit PhaC
VVNPPSPPRRSHWTREQAADAADAWLDGASEAPGSWWPDWFAWVARHGGRMRRAPAGPGNAAHPAIEPAPGRYVRESAG